MKPIESLNELLTENLRMLYDAEMSLQSIVFTMNDRAESGELGRMLTRYIERIKDKIARLDQIFVILREDLRGGENRVMSEISNRITTLLRKIIQHDVRDAAIIGEMQRINHILIADYGTACAFAKTLAMNDVAKLLHETLEDEKQTDNELTAIANEKINGKAREILI
ncbi:MAG TPA: DUF892 family protein [Bacteroidia bacterium]